MKKIILLLSLLAAPVFAQDSAIVRVGTNGSLLATTNFFNANAAAVAQSVLWSPKVSLSTNYTVTSELLLFCTGTNQIITLPNATNVTPGRAIRVHVASTSGSVILTNATGAQTISGALFRNIAATNSLVVVSDGLAWW